MVLGMLKGQHHSKTTIPKDTNRNLQGKKRKTNSTKSWTPTTNKTKKKPKTKHMKYNTCIYTEKKSNRTTTHIH